MRAEAAEQRDRLEQRDAVTGSITLSSSSEPVWPKAIVASLPTTRATTIVRLSTITGFTLPGMIEEPGWVSGSASSPRPARGPMPISRMSEAIFHRPSAIVRSAAVGRDHGVERRLGVEVVRRLADRQPGELREPDAGPRRELRVRVDPGPDRGPAEGHRQQLVARRLGAPDRLLDLARVARELLAEPDRRRVLEVGPAGLDDAPELVGLGRERRLQLDQRRDQLLLDRDGAPRAGAPSGSTSFELWQRLTSSLGWTLRRRAAPTRGGR